MIISINNIVIKNYYNYYSYIIIIIKNTVIILKTIKKLAYLLTSEHQMQIRVITTTGKIIQMIISANFNDFSAII